MVITLTFQYLSESRHILFSLYTSAPYRRKSAVYGLSFLLLGFVSCWCDGGLLW